MSQPRPAAAGGTELLEIVVGQQYLTFNKRSPAARDGIEARTI